MDPVVRGMNRRTRARAAALALAAIVTLAGCVAPYTGNVNGPRVAVIGDSITRLAEPRIRASLEPTHRIAVDGRSGHTIAEQQDTASVYAAHPDGPPHVVVINLGTNDGARGYDPTWSALGLLHMASKFPYACVVFTTLSTHTGNPQANRFAEELNRGIRLASNYVDWDAISADPRTTSDKVHPTSYGAALLASATRAAVLRCTR